jgi:homopolymeric O-antigen transport system ATP-binding protein
MTYVHIKDVNVEIPIYDSHALRLIRLPSFHLARVGTSTVSQSRGIMIMHAIKNLSLELKEGDRVSLIGHNGAGKTTLLRLVAGIYPAISGTVDVSGTVFALLRSGAPLVPDATGFENIRLIATIRGWPQAQMNEHVRDIAAFSELGEYLSLPVRVYSAGMQARLAFALATMRPPDILLIDEGIGAGDAEFQEKAQVRVRQFVSRAKIMLLASHSKELCTALCSKALLLSKGEKVFFGDINEAFERYAKLRQ